MTMLILVIQIIGYLENHIIHVASLDRLVCCFYSNCNRLRYDSQFEAENHK